MGPVMTYGAKQGWMGNTHRSIPSLKGTNNSRPVNVWDSTVHVPSCAVPALCPDCTAGNDHPGSDRACVTRAATVITGWIATVAPGSRHLAVSAVAKSWRLAPDVLRELQVIGTLPLK